jgi:hypothetical protein
LCTWVMKVRTHFFFALSFRALPLHIAPTNRSCRTQSCACPAPAQMGGCTVCYEFPTPALVTHRLVPMQQVCPCRRTRTSSAPRLARARLRQYHRRAISGGTRVCVQDRESGTELGSARTKLQCAYFSILPSESHRECVAGGEWRLRTESACRPGTEFPHDGMLGA